MRVVFWSLLLLQPVGADDPAFEDRVREIASELRCVVCQNLSVADSPSEMATQMRGIVRQQLRQGRNAEEIKAYFVSKYGDWVLLAPPRRGFSLTVWVLPYVVLGMGLLLALWRLYRWSRAQRVQEARDIDPAVLRRIRDELASGEGLAAQSDDPASSAKSRVYADLRELEFDHQAGKLSPQDYRSLRHRYESQAASILAQEPSQAASAPPGSSAPEPRGVARTAVAQRGWVLAVGAVILVAGGVSVGLLLGQSVRPRTSTEDSITGDFMTGTPESARSANPDLDEVLARGQAAFERKDLKGAIEQFKAVLGSDPGNPLANAYMGLILAQAGHSDAALLALDRALTRAPRLPVALWARGMILYRDKRDLAGAHDSLSTLLQLLPPGGEKEAIQSTLAEIEKEKANAGGDATAQREPGLTGTITVDPGLAGKVDPAAVLFIIARKPGVTRGPPLAVERIAVPSFPLSFTLGPDNVMIPGTPFSGSVDLTVRLDTDGNPMTREPGSLTGTYPGNPVAIGTRDLVITIDQTAGE